MGLDIFESIEPMRELWAGGVKVSLKRYHLDALADVECACTELDKDLDDPDDNLSNTL
jgi:hypothetical protein